MSLNSISSKESDDSNEQSSPESPKVSLLYIFPTNFNQNLQHLQLIDALRKEKKEPTDIDVQNPLSSLFAHFF